MAITKVSPGLLDLDSGITISTTDNSDNITLISTDADANSGPTLSFFRNSSSPADNDNTGLINFIAENDASEQTTYGSILMQLEDVSNGSEDASFYIQTIKAGAIHTPLRIKGTETIFNEDSVDQDFRVESDGNANMLFVDGGNNSVMIGGTALASGQRFAVNVTNADSSTNEPVVFNNETHSAANAYGILIKYSGSSGNWSSGTGQNFIRCTDDGESNQKFAVTGAGQVQAQTGIAFAGDTAAANTLDDYEEGTWTPNLQRVDGSTPATFSTHSGSATYTKIGNMVNVNCFLNNISAGSSDGSSYWVLYNIPFASQVIDYTGGILAYNSTSATSVYVGDASGNAILTIGSNVFTGALSGQFMFNITFRVS